MFRRLLFALVALVLPAAPVLAQPLYSDVFFFGTSALDTGNWLLDDDLKNHPAAPTADKGYYDGRWQSGPAFSDYLAQALGHDAMPSLAGGQNYAYGFGWVGPLAGEAAPTPGTLRAQTALYFSSQVTSALTDYSSVLPSDALYVINIGSNDFDFFGRTTAQAGVVAGAAASQIQRLVNAGATNFLVQTLGGAVDPFLAYNAALLGGLSSISGITLTVLDTRVFNQTVLLAPGYLAGLGITSFGSCNTDAACLEAAIAATTAGNPYLDSPYLLFDTVHRDPKVSQAMARYAVAQLPVQVPEPASASLLVLSALGLCLVGRRQRRH